MNEAPRSRRSRLWLLGLLGGALVLLGAVDDTAREALRYERHAALAGEYWRWLTGHLVHGSTQHLILNMAGLGLTAALFGDDYSARHWLWLLAASVIAIDLGFVFLEPQLEWYVGFSGVLHGALAAGAIAWLRTMPKAYSVGLCAFVIGKLAWEQWRGALPLSGDLPVVVDAHLYGAIGGAVGAITLLVARQPWSARRRSL